MLLYDEEKLSTALLIKAYLRRGLAFEKTERFGRARSDFTKVKELDPSNL